LGRGLGGGGIVAESRVALGQEFAGRAALFRGGLGRIGELGKEPRGFLPPPLGKQDAALE
jgi:hypothetical protein